MSDRESTVTYRDRRRAEVTRSGRIRGVKSLMAGAIVAGLVVSGATPAMADIGGGGVGGGSGNSGAANYYSLFTGDNRDESGNPRLWGQASTDSFADAMEQSMQWASAMRGREGINTACNAAMSQAISRSNGASNRARVVQVGVSVDQQNGNWFMGWGGTQTGMRNWYQERTNANYWQPMLPGFSGPIFEGIFNAFMASIGDTPRVVCVALNDTEVVNYDLSISTDAVGAFPSAGTNGVVSDRINASRNGSNIGENVTASVTLNWGGVEGNGRGVTKDVSIANEGITASPEFGPGDFGWSSWPSGRFWFDVNVPQQGKMKNAVSHAGVNDSRENWAAATTAPRKVLTSGSPSDQLANDEVLVSGQFYNAQVTARTNGYSSSMSISDVVATDQVFIGSSTADDASKLQLLDPNGSPASGATFAIDRSGSQVKITGTVTNIPNVHQAREYTLVVPTYLRPTKTDYSITDFSQVCYTAAQSNCIAGNTATVRKVTAAPDKVWVLDPEGGLTTADPTKTNQSGADNKVFLMGDEVSAVVNGRIPGKLGEPMSNYQLVDDWTLAGAYVDFTDATRVAVYTETTPGSGTYVSVTNQFDVEAKGTVTTATAKPEFLATTKGLGADRKTKLIVSGSFRADFDTNGQVVQLRNAGREVWNNETIASNEPPVYTWTPNPNKQVLGSSEESGDMAHDNIGGTSVWPGQKLEYSVGVDLRVPIGTARGIKSLAIEDVYDPFFTPDKASVEFWDSRDASNPRPIPRSAYKLTFDEDAHSFTAAFTAEWLSKNVAESGANSQWLTQGWLTMRLTGTVRKDIPEGSTVRNQAFQVINGARTASDVPVVQVPTITPDKESLSTDQVDIDGKTVVTGDIILYRLTLDARPARSALAYNVHKLGLVDRYDAEHLAVSASGIRVLDKTTGEDVTARFNVRVTDGVAYVFAKQVDTEAVYGGTIAGDPQPADLGAYDQATIRPLEDPTIDQTLLGKEYFVTIPATVTKATEGHVIENQATQNVQNTYKSTRVVSNPLKDIDPTKDVVIGADTKDASIEGTEVRMNTLFNYRLTSSEIPANRAYAASQWSISDTFDRVHDQYTGVWAVYANTDVFDGAEALFRKGDLLQSSAGRESAPWDGLFDVIFDEETYTLTVTATKKYLDLVGGRGDLVNGFSVYAKMERVAPGEGIANTATETYNTVARDTNEVTTFTIEYPSIAVEKFTLSEGPEDGKRPTADTAQVLTDEQLAEATPTEDSAAGIAGVEVQKGVEVGIRFTNTGDVPLKDVTLVDVTQQGMYGQLEGLVCAAPADPAAPDRILGDTVIAPDENGNVWVHPSSVTELAVGQVVDCRGTLRGMERGMTHADTVLVSGKSIFTDTAVKANDAWFARALSTPAIEVVEYTFHEGRESGDRNAAAEALELTPSQGTSGVMVAFDVTNAGDESLSGVEFAAATQEGFSGSVKDVVWLDPIEPLAMFRPLVPAAGAPVAIAAHAAETTALVTEVPAEENTEPAPAEAAETPTPKPESKIVEVDGVKYAERALSELSHLAAGEHVLLVGTLLEVEEGGSHVSEGFVTAAGSYSGIEVSDDDPWNAKLAAPALEARGAVTGDGILARDSRASLFGGAALLVIAAALVAEIMRRRQRSRMTL